MLPAKEHKAYIVGYNDGTFRPEDNVTRAEFVTMAVRYCEIFNEVKKTGYTVKYTDVSSSYGAYTGIAFAKNIGWLNGYADGTFINFGLYNSLQDNPNGLSFSYIHPVTKEIGTVIRLDEYVPTKEGYIFVSWYSDPRTKQQQVTEITLNENIIVFAKWIDDGTPKAAPEVPVITSTEEILAYGNYIDEATGVPVTALWVQQNARLNELMQIYNQKFNK